MMPTMELPTYQQRAKGTFRRRVAYVAPTAVTGFLLMSSNGGKFYTSYASARTGDLSFTGALVWTIVQSGDGGNIFDTGMQFSSLTIQCFAGVKHQGQKVSNLALVAHLTSGHQAIITRPNVTFDGLTLATGAMIFFQDTAAQGGTCKNIVLQEDASIQYVIENVALCTGTVTNCLCYDTAFITGYAESSLAGPDVEVVVNVTNCSAVSSNIAVDATLTRGHPAFFAQTVTDASSRVCKATLNCVNCVSVGSGNGFGEIPEGGSGEVCTCNLTNCRYYEDGRAMPGAVITRGTQTNSSESDSATEFVSTTDMYSPKSGAERIKGGTATSVTTDALGAPYTSTPNIGASAQVPLTKLYLRTNGALFTISGEQSSATADKTWTGAATCFTLETTKSVQSQTLTSTTTLASAVQQKHFVQAFATYPLDRPRVVGGGTWALNIADRENNLSANFWINGVCAYVWRPSTSSVVGVLVDDTTGTLGGLEASAINSTQVSSFGFATSSVSAQGGDIIVVELWATFTQASASAFTVGFAYDGQTETEGENTVVTNHASFLLLSDDLTFEQTNAGSVTQGMFQKIIGSGVW